MCKIGNLIMIISLFTKRIPASILIVTFIITAAGCIISEYEEYRISLNADGESGTLIITKNNLQSDESDPVKVQKDFDELISDWKNDQYLLDKMKSGEYVKSRRLYMEKGRLVWNEKAIFSDIHKIAGKSIVNDTMNIGFKKEEAAIKTNAILIQTKDSTIVQWPLSMKNFVLKIQRKDFKSKSDFAAMFAKFKGSR